MEFRNEAESKISNEAITQMLELDQYYRTGLGKLLAEEFQLLKKNL